MLQLSPQADSPIIKLQYLLQNSYRFVCDLPAECERIGSTVSSQDQNDARTQQPPPISQDEFVNEQAGRMIQILDLLNQEADKLPDRLNDPGWEGRIRQLETDIRAADVELRQVYTEASAMYDEAGREAGEALLGQNMHENSTIDATWDIAFKDWLQKEEIPIEIPTEMPIDMHKEFPKDMPIEIHEEIRKEIPNFPHHIHGPDTWL